MLPPGRVPSKRDPGLGRNGTGFSAKGFGPWTPDWVKDGLPLLAGGGGPRTRIRCPRLRRCGVAQRPVKDRAGERVAAVEVDVLKDQRAEPGEDLLRDRAAGGLALGAGFVEVDRVPEDGRVEHQSERAELVFHALVVALAELAVLAVADPARERVPGLLEAELGADHPAVALVVEHLQDVERLEDPAVVRERFAETGRPSVAGDHPDQVIRADLAGDQRAGDPEHVRPVPADPIEPHTVSGELIQRAVAGGYVDPPCSAVCDVRDPRRELVAADREQAEDDVRVGGGVGDHDVWQRAAVAVMDSVEDEQRVAQRSRDDQAADAHHLIVDDVQPCRAAVTYPEVPWVRSGPQG